MFKKSFPDAICLHLKSFIFEFWEHHLKEWSIDRSEAEIAERRATPLEEIFDFFISCILQEECTNCEEKPYCAFPELCIECSEFDKHNCLDCSDPKRTCDQCNGNRKIKCQDCRKRRKEFRNRKPCQYEKLRDFVTEAGNYEELHSGVDGNFYCFPCNTTDKKKCECKPFECACGDDLCSKCAINKYWESQLKEETEEKKPELKRIRLASLVSDSIDLTADDDESDAEENSSRRVRARASPAREEGELSS